MSPGLPNGPRKRAEIEAWTTLIEGIAWAVLRVLGGIGGALLIYVTAFLLHDDPVEVRVLLILVGAVCLGPAVAAGLAQVLQAMRSGGSE